VPQVQALADMMVQTERFGTPLMQALRAMAVEYRAGRLLRAEARAARLPALMTVPMIAFILPPLFVVLIGPAVVEAMG
jgi:tight adherence protein C